MSLVLTLTTLGLGYIFLNVGLAKLLDHDSTTAATQRLAPRLVAWSSPAAWLLGVWELTSGLLLLLLPASSLGLASVVALLVIFTGAVHLALRRGGAPAPCGCGNRPSPINETLLTRNIVMLGVALLALTWSIRGGDHWLSSNAHAALGSSLIAFLILPQVYFWFRVTMLQWRLQVRFLWATPASVARSGGQRGAGLPGWWVTATDLARAFYVLAVPVWLKWATLLSVAKQQRFPPSSLRRRHLDLFPWHKRLVPVILSEAPRPARHANAASHTDAATRHAH